MNDTIENRMKIKAYDNMTKIWDRYLYVIDEGFDDYRSRFLNGEAHWTEDDEESIICFLLYELENSSNNFDTTDHIKYYLSSYIFSFDTEINRKKIEAFDRMKMLYQEYKMKEDCDTGFANKLIILLTEKQKPQSFEEFLMSTM